MTIDTEAQRILRETIGGIVVQGIEAQARLSVLTKENEELKELVRKNAQSQRREDLQA